MTGTFYILAGFDNSAQWSKFMTPNLYILEGSNYLFGGYLLNIGMRWLQPA